MDSYFFFYLKKKFKEKKIIVYFRDDDTLSNSSEFSFGKTRKYSTLDDKKINPIKEWLYYLKKLALIDEYIGINIDQINHGIRIYPEVINRIMPKYIPIDFKKNIIDRIFKECYKPTKKVNEILFELKNKFVVSLHLRRNAKKIIEIAEKTESKIKNVTFLILGSSEHQHIPNYNLLKTIELIDSYKKGLALLDVLYISKHSNYFIGGRGGFELFHWLNCNPSINIFDEVGYREIFTGWWSKSLWKKNKINQLFNVNHSTNSIVSLINK